MNKRRHIISLTLLLVVVASALVANLVAGNTPALGLDLQGGASVTLQPDGEFDPAGLDVAVEIIRARVDSIGVAEPEIILQGSTVIVNLPGVKDQQQALDIIGRTGELLLRPVLQSGMLNPNADTTIPGSATTVVDSSTTVPGQTSDSVEDGAHTISGGPGASRVISTATTTPDSSTSVPTETTDAQAVTPIADAPQTAENLGLGDDPNDPTQTVLLLDKNGIAYVVDLLVLPEKFSKMMLEPMYRLANGPSLLGCEAGQTATSYGTNSPQHVSIKQQSAQQVN